MFVEIFQPSTPLGGYTLAITITTTTAASIARDTDRFVGGRLDVIEQYI